MAKQSYAITVAGGGSTYTPGVVLTLLAKRDVFPINKITLYDNDAERQETIATAARTATTGRQTRAPFFPSSPERLELGSAITPRPPSCA